MQVITEGCKVSCSQTIVLKAILIYCSEENVISSYRFQLQLVEFFIETRLMSNVKWPKLHKKWLNSVGSFTEKIGT